MKGNVNGSCNLSSFLTVVVINFRRGVVVTALVVSTKLLYVESG